MVGNYRRCQRISNAFKPNVNCAFAINNLCQYAAMKHNLPGKDSFHIQPPVKVGRGMIRVSIFTSVPSLLRLLGQDPDQVLGELGLNPDLLSDPDNTFPFATAGALLEHCVIKTRCKHFGLLLGQRGNPATLGVTGQLTLISTDVGSALHNLCDYLYHHDRGAAPSLAVTGDLAVFSYAIYEQDVPASDQIYAGAMAVACQILRSLCGTDWHPAEVRLPFRRPDDTQPFKDFFKAPVRFGDEQAALVFPAGWLLHPLNSADGASHRRIKEILAANDSRELVDQVRSILRSMLVGGNVSEAALANALGMSRRTLIRRLRAENSSFHEISRNVRQQVACQMLRDTDAPIADVSRSLGYVSASPFIRAFKQRTGLTPASWRLHQTSSLKNNSSSNDRVG